MLIKNFNASGIVMLNQNFGYCFCIFVKTDKTGLKSNFWLHVLCKSVFLFNTCGQI